jgi:hypothetical protein
MSRMKDLLHTQTENLLIADGLSEPFTDEQWQRATALVMAR